MSIHADKYINIVIIRSSFGNKVAGFDYSKLSKISQHIITVDYNDSQIIAKINSFQSNKNDLLIITEQNIDISMLSDLTTILHSFEKFASISPRGANMGLQSLPLNSNYDNNFNENKKSLSVFNVIKPYLKKYNTVPFTNINCVLLNAKLIQKFGLFDIKSSSLQDALNDWCFRVSQFGFSSITSNHNFITTHSKIANDSANNFLKKYKYAQQSIEEYLNIVMSPIERFAPFYIKNYYPKIRVLLCLYHLAPVYNGTSEHALTMVNKLITLFSNKYDFYILVSRENDDFFNISKKYNNIVYTDCIVGTYQIGITFFQIISPINFAILNKVCFKIISTVLDMISFRVNSILNDTDYNTFIKSLNFSDGIVTISKFTRDDILSSLILDNTFSRDLIEPIMLSIPDELEEIDNSKPIALPFDKYILIIGNHYKHKAILEIYPLIKNSNKNFIIIGFKIDNPPKNIYTVKSGKIDYATIKALYKNAAALLFPSEYEGFGLPVVNAYKYSKKIIVAKTEINIEVKKFFKISDANITFFNNYPELEQILSSIILENNCEYKNINYTYNDVAIKTEKFINKILSIHVDSQKLIERDNVSISSGILKNIGELLNIYKPKKVTIKELIKIYIKNKYSNTLYHIKEKIKVF